MSKDTLINLRINSELKNDFQSIISQDGFTMSEVVEACMKDIVIRGMIPINIRSRLKPKNHPILNIPFIKQCVDDILSKMNDKRVKTVSIFGSYAKGVATPNSDVDLFVETEEGFDLMDLTNLQLLLQTSLGKEVDLVTDNGDEYFINNIKRERIRIYERI